VLDANAQQVQNQDFGSGDIFVLCPPNGWIVSEVPGLKFKISRRAPTKGVAHNIVVADESYNKMGPSHEFFLRRLLSESL